MQQINFVIKFADTFIQKSYADKFTNDISLFMDNLIIKIVKILII